MFFFVFVINVRACAVSVDEGQQRQEGRSVIPHFNHAQDLSIEERLAIKNELAQAANIGDSEKVAEIITRGVRFDFQDTTYFNHHQCWLDTLAFMATVGNGHKQVVEVLLDADQRSAYGVGIAFYAAVMYGNVEMMESLYRAGEVSSDIPALYGNNTLLMVAAGRQAATIQWLLKAGARVFIDAQEMRKNFTALMMAVRNSAGVEVINLLLGANAAVDKQNDKGNTALGLVVMDCHYSQQSEMRHAVIRDLILAGASPLIRNNKNKTPWDKATAEMKCVMRVALQERTSGRVISEILTRRGLRPYGFCRESPQGELPQEVACLIDEFATPSLSDKDKKIRVSLLEQSRARWLAEMRGCQSAAQGKKRSVAAGDEFRRGMEWACIVYSDSCSD